MDKLNKAIKFATDAHDGQTRKLRTTPYILHPLEAASIAATLTEDEDIMCAAVLHDTVEDTSVTMEDIKREFGDRVAQLVAMETENKRKHLSPECTWKIRKEESLQHLKESNDKAVKLLWLSDKLSNMRSIFDSYVKVGDELFNEFHEKDKKQHEWYYSTIAELLRPYFENTGAFKEYSELVNYVFKWEVTK